MSLRTFFLIVAVFLFVFEAIGKRIKFRPGFGLMGAGLACVTASFLVG
jgi:hypothetical protein